MEPVKYDHNKQLIALIVITLSSFHCINVFKNTHVILTFIVVSFLSGVYSLKIANQETQ